MGIELININEKMKKSAIDFFQLAAKKPCKNMLFLQNNIDCIGVVKSIVLKEKERIISRNNKINNLCRKLSISPRLISNRSLLINRLVFNENTLSDFIVTALNESHLFRSNFLKLIDKKLGNINNLRIIRENSLWDNKDVQSSGRADIQIDIYGKINYSILIEHKINHTLSNSQIDKYCIAGKKLHNPYFVLLSSKDSDFDILEANREKISTYLGKAPILLTHYDILKILVQTIKNENVFSHKYLVFWLVEIVYNFYTEKILQKEITKFSKFLTDSNFTLTTLESCYG